MATPDPPHSGLLEGLTDRLRSANVTNDEIMDWIEKVCDVLPPHPPSLVFPALGLVKLCLPPHPSLISPSLISPFTLPPSSPPSPSLPHLPLHPPSLISLPHPLISPSPFLISPFTLPHLSLHPPSSPLHPHPPCLPPHSLLSIDVITLTSVVIMLTYSSVYSM